MKFKKHNRVLVNYKGYQRKGIVQETKMDKVKVYMPDVPKTDWFEENDVEFNLYGWL